MCIRQPHLMLQCSWLTGELVQVALTASSSSSSMCDALRMSCLCSFSTSLLGADAISADRSVVT